MELTWELAAFAIFSIFTLGGGLMVVLERNLFHAALYLMLSLFGISGLFVILVAPFLAAIQVLVYIGAIAILILFSIMLTRRVMGIQESWNTQWIGAAVIAVALFVALLFTLTPLADELSDEGSDFANINANFDLDEPPTFDESIPTVLRIGLAFGERDQFVLPFELAGLLLTAVLIGAIVVARENEV